MHRRAEAGNTAAKSVPLGTASDVAADVSAADDPPVKVRVDTYRPRYHRRVVTPLNPWPRVGGPPISYSGVLRFTIEPSVPCAVLHRPAPGVREMAAPSSRGSGQFVLHVARAQRAEPRLADDANPGVTEYPRGTAKRNMKLMVARHRDGAARRRS